MNLKLFFLDDAYIFFYLFSLEPVLVINIFIKY